MNSLPADVWRQLDSGPCDYAFNMALDEALLEFAPQLGQPVLRFYGWKQPVASFGYFQKFSEIERVTHLRPLVRRPTGGGLVPHDADWTYSVIVPPNHAWYELRASESYERVHQWIQIAFTALGVATELAACCRKDIPGQCFAGYEKSDVLRFGKKIAGAAQRRTKSGLLIQGSLQPQPPGVMRSAWQSAMTAAATSQWAARFEALQLNSSLSSRTAQLVEEKFSLAQHNQRR
ncbi:MAG TPA: hypothetical protein VK846_14380 [Candidatus Limnocylindria bacterium]|nr:hypothetical protein [Candidatus Limnocylindria bacterium]